MNTINNAHKKRNCEIKFNKNKYVEICQYFSIHLNWWANASTVIFTLRWGDFGLFEHLLSWQYWPQPNHKIQLLEYQNLFHFCPYSSIEEVLHPYLPRNTDNTKQFSECCSDIFYFSNPWETKVLSSFFFLNYFLNSYGTRAKREAFRSSLLCSCWQRSLFTTLKLRNFSSFHGM